MSHFTVLVVGDDYEALLQPFHEFECTGTNDQYVQEIDKTEEARETFAADTSTRIKAPDGSLHSFFDDKGNWRPEFSQVDVTASVYDRSRRTYYIPPGHEKVEVPTSEVEKFSDWAADYFGWKVLRPGEDADLEGEHKYGYIQIDANGDVVKCIDRTNPNKKWDWYQVGGRWSNKILLKSGNRCNSAKVGDIDWDGMIADFGEKAAAEHDAITSALQGREVITWAQALKKCNAGEITIEQARDLYNGQEIVKELQSKGVLDSWDGAETLSKVMSCDRATYIKREGETNATTWALLHKGEWIERGSMGWFGMSDATDQSKVDYAQTFWGLVRALPTQTVVTVVDCHI